MIYFNNLFLVNNYPEKKMILDAEAANFSRVCGVILCALVEQKKNYLFFHFFIKITGFIFVESGARKLLSLLVLESLTIFFFTYIYTHTHIHKGRSAKLSQLVSNIFEILFPNHIIEIFRLSLLFLISKCIF